MKDGSWQVVKGPSANHQSPSVINYIRFAAWTISLLEAVPFIVGLARPCFVLSIKSTHYGISDGVNEIVALEQTTSLGTLSSFWGVKSHFWEGWIG